MYIKKGNTGRVHERMSVKVDKSINDIINKFLRSIGEGARVEFIGIGGGNITYQMFLYSESSQKNIQKIANKLNNALKGKVFTLDGTYILIYKSIITLSSLKEEYLLTLEYATVNIYLNKGVIPDEMIYTVIAKLNDVKDLTNAIYAIYPNLDEDLEDELYRRLYLQVYPEDFGRLKHIIDTISSHLSFKFWKSAYLEGLPGREYGIIVKILSDAIEIYDISPVYFDQFSKIFTEYHLGTSDDYIEWLDRNNVLISTTGITDFYQHVNPSTLETYFSKRKYKLARPASATLLFDLVTGRTYLDDIVFDNMDFTFDSDDKMEYDWFFGRFVPYVIQLQISHPEISYIGFLPYPILVRFIKYGIINNLPMSLPQVVATIEIHKRNPINALKDIQ